MQTFGGISFAVAKGFIESQFDKEDIIGMKKNEKNNSFDFYISENACKQCINKKPIMKYKERYPSIKIFATTSKEDFK